MVRRSSWFSPTTATVTSLPTDRDWREIQIEIRKRNVCLFPSDRGGEAAADKRAVAAACIFVGLAAWETKGLHDIPGVLVHADQASEMDR